jgi:hypothetical protein
MEVIKKTILQALTTGKTGNDYIIIPDLSVNYFIKIVLTQDAIDFGFFKSFSEPVPIESTFYVDSDNYVFTDYNNDEFIT